MRAHRLVRGAPRATVLLLALTAAGALGAAAHGAAAQPGATMTVSVAIRGATNLAAFDAAVHYDPAVVAFTGATRGAALPAAATWLEPVTDTVGIVVVGAYTAGEEGADADGPLAELTFTTLADGATGIRLDAAGSGAYGPLGASIAPPARLGLTGIAPPPVYMPYANR